MYNSIRRKWFAMDNSMKSDLKEYSDKEKRKNEKTTDELIKKVNSYIKKKPSDEVKRKEWELEGVKILKEFLRKDTLLNLNNLGEENQDIIVEVTKSFIKEAKEFDDDIKNEYISQGLRNLWIINILQMLFKREIKLTASAFAYSIIYPYTDNFLDDLDVEEEMKREFNKNLYLMLKGENVTCKTILEERVYSLLKNIESEYDRRDFSEVYDSLLKIYDGQVKSMKQQENFIPYECDVLGISIEKGAASVLADGYLVKGRLNSVEKEFCLQYGFLLQMIDDFQDLKSDKKRCNTTMMSQLAGRYYLDGILNKLINYTCYIYESSELLKYEKSLCEVMKDNCLLLILCSLALNKEYFSEEYISKIEKYIPFNISYIEKQSKTSMRKLKKLEGIL